jgi:hypothetical protein
MVDYCNVNLSPWQCGAVNCIGCEYNKAKEDNVADSKYMSAEKLVSDVILLAGKDGANMRVRLCDDAGNLYIVKRVSIDTSDSTVWLDVDIEEVDDEIPSASDISA